MGTQLWMEQVLGLLFYQRRFRILIPNPKKLLGGILRLKHLSTGYGNAHQIGNGTGNTNKSLTQAVPEDRQNVCVQKSVPIIDGFNIKGSTIESGALNLQYFDFSPSFLKSEDWKSKFVKSMLVYPQFTNVDEEKGLMKEIEPFISRLHYEDAHWDDAIHSYRETERSVWNKSNTAILDRIRAIGFPPPVRQLKLVHVLDLSKTGLIKPHIDSVRFCGNTIAGLSLLSDCIMRLRHEIQKDFYCDVLLPQRSLYVMNDFVRYEFTHEILAEKGSKFKDDIVPRDRRISIICRNEPGQTPGPVFEPMVAGGNGTT